MGEMFAVPGCMGELFAGTDCMGELFVCLFVCLFVWGKYFLGLNWWEQDCEEAKEEITERRGQIEDWGIRWDYMDWSQ